MNNKQLTLNESAKYLGIDVNELVAETVAGKVKYVRGQRGKPFTYKQEQLDEYKSVLRNGTVTPIENRIDKRGTKPVGKPVGKEHYYKTKEAAEYLGVTPGAVQAAVHRKTLVPDHIEDHPNKTFFFERHTLDSYKSRVELTREATTMALRMGRYSKSDGYETVRKLLELSKKRGHDNPWKTISELIESAS